MNPTSHSIFGRRIIVEFVCRHTHLFYCNSSEHQQTRQNHSRLRAWYFRLNAWFLILQRRVNWIQNIFMRVLSDSMFGLVCVQRKNQRSFFSKHLFRTRSFYSKYWCQNIAFSDSNERSGSNSAAKSTRIVSSTFCFQIRVFFVERNQRRHSNTWTHLGTALNLSRYGPRDHALILSGIFMNESK